MGVKTFDKPNIRSFIMKISLCGIFIAMAIVMRNFSIMIPLGGVQSAMRISFSGVFSIIPAFMYGPLYGGIISALMDIIGVIIKPEGAYIPWFTITAFIWGMLRGVVWKPVAKLTVRRLQVILISTFSVILSLGLFNSVCHLFFKDFGWTAIITKSSKLTGFVTYGLIVLSVAGLLILGLNHIIVKYTKNKNIENNFLKVYFTLLSVGSVMTTINTILIMKVYGIKTAFMVFWIPRIIEEVTVSIVVAYGISLMLPIVNKLMRSYTRSGAANG